MIYKLFKQSMGGGFVVFNTDTNVSFLADGDSLEKKLFVQQINADEAQLEDVDGIAMSHDDAVTFVNSLP